MKLSALNQLRGTISGISYGSIAGIVTLTLGDISLKAYVPITGINRLGLVAGQEAYAVFNSSSVVLSSQGSLLPNTLCGRVTEVVEGAVSGLISVELTGNYIVSADVLLGEINQLSLKVGDEVGLQVNSKNIFIGVAD